MMFEEAKEWMAMLGTAGRFGKATAEQLALVRQTQTRLVDECHGAFDRWCDRQQRTAEALVKASQQSLNAKTPQAIVEVWTHWSEGTMERMSEQAKDQLAVGMSLARCCADGLAVPLYAVTSNRANGKSGAA